MLRAPKPEPRPHYDDREHTVEGHWEPTRWLRVIDPDGSVWMESSDEAEAREQAKVLGRSLERRWVFVPAVHQYRRLAP